MLVHGSEIWSVKIVRRAVLSAAMLFLFINIYSQGKNSSLIPLRVKKGSYVYLYDSLYHFNHDTILYLSNSLLPDDPEAIEKTRVFYDSLEAKASRRALTKRLYDLAIVLPPDGNYQDRRSNINQDYNEHKGKKIRRITVMRLDPFGTNINNPDLDAAKGFSKFLNNTHPTTKEFVIKNYLMFKEGDELTSLIITESERILRRLKYIDDVRIVVIPVSEEMVDIHIVTRDVYSLGLYYDIRGTKAGTIEVFERSLFGLGHDFIISFPYNYYNEYQGFGYQLSYNMRNISRSLIDASATYSNALGREFYDLNVQRRFVTATTKYAGGFNIRETFTSNDLDTLETRAPVEYNNMDLWFGRSFMLNKSKLTRLVVSGRYIYNNVYERPEISSTSYHSLQKFRIALASISLVREKYFKTNLIYNYGRTEDIPYGSNFQLTYGREINEFKKRSYYGSSLSLANMPGELGYFYANAQAGVFLSEGVEEQGVLDLKLSYISNLTSVGKFRFRYFADLRYTRGYKRFDDEYLRVGDNTGIRGFSNDTIRPDQRIIMNLETVSFTPIYIYGFRFAFYAFSDLGLASNDATFQIKNNIISEIGVGLRIRNDNLIFKTIQFRFSFFPLSPPYSNLKYFDVTGEKLLESPNFNPVSPRTIYYR